MIEQWQPAHLRDLARHIVVTGISTLIAGLLVGGIGSRLFMRVAAATAVDSAQGRLTEAGFRVGEVTVGGSVGLIVFLAVFTCLVGAILLVVFYPWITKAGQWDGVAFGVTLFAIGSASSDVLNPDNIDFRILDNGPLVTSMIVALFVSFGVVSLRSYRWLGRRLPDGTGKSKIVYFVLATIGLFFGLPLLPIIGASSELCSCDPPRVTFAFVIFTMVATLLWWIGSIKLSKRLNAGAINLGRFALAGTLVTGLYRAFSDTVEVLRL